MTHGQGNTTPDEVRADEEKYWPLRLQSHSMTNVMQPGAEGINGGATRAGRARTIGTYGVKTGRSPGVVGRGEGTGLPEQV